MWVALIDAHKAHEIACGFYHGGNSHCSTCGINFLNRDGRCQVKTSHKYGSIGVDSCTTMMACE
jgi:hypothetical protein